MATLALLWVLAMAMVVVSPFAPGTASLKAKAAVLTYALEQLALLELGAVS